MTANEVIEFFEVWLLKQNLFNPTEHNATDARIYQKACDLIESDVEFWQRNSMWDLYNKAKQEAV